MRFLQTRNDEDEKISYAYKFIIALCIGDGIVYRHLMPLSLFRLTQ